MPLAGPARRVLAGWLGVAGPTGRVSELPDESGMCQDGTDGGESGVIYERPSIKNLLPPLLPITEERLPQHMHGGKWSKGG